MTSKKTWFSRSLVLLTVLVCGFFVIFDTSLSVLAQSREVSERSRPNTENRQNRLLSPLERSAWFQQQRAFPNIHIPQGAYWRAQVQKQALLARQLERLRGASPEIAAQASPFSGVTWTADGPQPVPAYYGGTPYSGRTTSIAVHPSDPNTVYLGTAAGGVWKTTDGGQTWTPLTDAQASLAIGAVAIDPNNPNTIFAGTGEADFSSDSYYGQGLLKSTDAGATWTLIRKPFTSGDTAPSFTQIAVQPGNSNVVLAANLGGLYRSSDGGQTWTPVLNTAISAVMFDVKNSSVVYAGVGGFYTYSAGGTIFKSMDAGQTWTAISGSGTNIIPSPSAVLRTALTEDSAGKTVYAAFANSNFSTPGTLYSTTDGGANWTKLSSPSSSDGLDWYRDAIAVSPINSQVLYAAGASLFRSTDGGQTWAAITGVYADQHAMAFSADGSRMYVADDGGVFVTTSPTAVNTTFTSLNTGLNTLTFYPGFSLIPSKTHLLLAGTQDHGVVLYTGSLAWLNGEQSGFCGDAGGVYVDPQGKYAYAHCQGGNANWTANATGDTSTTSWVAAQSGINSSDRMPWVADIKGDPQTISTVYTATNHLYQSIDNAGAWTSISGDLTNGSSTITTIGVSPTDSNTIYTGAGDGTVAVTNNALSGSAATWKTLTGLPARSISKIVVQPDSSKDIYLTVSGFDTGHVFHSTNGGSTWTDISGDLPNTPVNSILADPGLLNTIYVATDTGVYVTSNGGTNWVPLGQGLPNVVVQDILMDQSTRKLYVITHGRGAWEATIPAVGLQASATSVSFGNQALNVTSAAQTVTLTNGMQSASLNLTGFQINGPFAQTNNCGTALAPGASCAVSITFSPTAVGAVQGSLTVSSSSNNVILSLSGTGLGTPNAVLNGASLTYTGQAVGISSSSQSIQLSNTGSASLTNIAISIAGTNAADFAETSTCGATLTAGASCTISVTFTPSSTGTRTAALSVTDNAAGSPQAASLSGTGVAPFTISATSASATVTSGTNATYQLALAAAQGTSLGSAVQLSCSGLPSPATCSFSPSAVASGATSQNVTLTVTTKSASTASMVKPGSRRAQSLTLAAFSLLSLLILPRRRSRVWLLVLAIFFAGLTGCGNKNSGSSSNSGSNDSGNSTGVSKGTYTATVTATQGTIYTTTQTLTLIVQ